jgi:methyl-accepting chemotaxis protein
MKQENTPLFSGLLLWQKFAILGGIAIILVAIPFYLFFSDQQVRINSLKQEQRALQPAADVLKVLQEMQKHRGLSSNVLAGVAAVEGKRKEQKDTVNQAVTRFDTSIKAIDYPGLAEAWSQIKAGWTPLASQVDAHALTPKQSFDEHTQLIARIVDMLDNIVDSSGMALDTKATSFYLIQSTLLQSPALTEQLGQTRALSTTMLAQAELAKGQSVTTQEERFRVSERIVRARDFFKNTLSSINKSVQTNAALKERLQAKINQAAKLTDDIIKLTQAEVIDAKTLTYPSTTYREKITAAIDATFTLNDAALAELGNTFNAQMDEARTTLLTLSGIVLIIFLAGAAVAVFITRSITKPVNGLVEVMNRLAAGDNEVRANPQTFDEIGGLGRQFDMMVDQRELVNYKIQRENETLNNSIIELLYAVAKLASKDLTAKAVVAEDVTGPVSDALNMLADETSKVLNKVTKIAKDVSEASQRVQTQSAMVIDVAETEKNEVALAADELNESSKAMLDIADLAFSCNEAAEKAIKNTDKAQETVLGTVQGITAIRDTIRETEKRIKRLGERSQEIGGVVSLIHDIAERTHILALNASMHAASAGEAGRGFAVVANEVQKLAENSREATTKISALVNNIQVETADTVTTMNEAISQVVKGTDLAQQAGDEMRETRETTANLVQLVQRIAASSTLQSETSKRLVERARQIQKSNDHTYGQLQDQGTQTELLVSLSEMLVDSVGVFTLPATAA